MQLLVHNRHRAVWSPAFRRFGTRLLSTLVWTLLFALPLARAAEPVSVELAIPKAMTRVIGDIIPLNWRFRNRGDEPVGFMWEGCCRVNGRVEMKREGPPRPPPGGVRPNHSGYGPGIYNASCLHCRLARQQSELTVGATPQGPATAHIFAKPIRLAPGASETLPSRLDNWVLLEQTGDYTLTGHYLGVHPIQQPQMPKNARLWTGRTTSSPVELSLLSVADYLTEGPSRAVVRGIGLHLSAPGELRPFEPATLRVGITNLSGQPRSFNWPGRADFWLVDDKGRRIPESQYALGRFGRLITLAPGAAESAEFVIRHDLLEGRPFGEYLAFVELRETSNTIRVPSNPVRIRWDINAATTAALIEQAANQPPIGARNPPLKLLRVHLGDVATHLRSLPANRFTGKSAKLFAELETASILKRLQPAPGRVDLNIFFPGDGSPQFQDLPMRKAFHDSGTSVAEQLATTIELRRHLGWSIGVTLRLNPDTRLSDLRSLTATLAPLGDRLAAPPATRVFNSTATAFSAIRFPGRPVAANVVIRIRSAEKNRVSYAVKTAPENAAANESFFLPDTIPGLALTSLPVGARIDDLLPASPAPLVIADSGLKWGEVLGQLSAFIDRGLPVDLIIE